MLGNLDEVRQDVYLFGRLLSKDECLLATQGGGDLELVIIVVEVLDRDDVDEDDARLFHVLASVVLLHVVLLGPLGKLLAMWQNTVAYQDIGRGTQAYVVLVFQIYLFQRHKTLLNYFAALKHDESLRLEVATLSLGSNEGCLLTIIFNEGELHRSDVIPNDAVREDKAVDGLFFFVSDLIVLDGHHHVALACRESLRVKVHLLQHLMVVASDLLGLFRILHLLRRLEQVLVVIQPLFVAVELVVDAN